MLPSRRNAHFQKTSILRFCLDVLGALGGFLGHPGGVLGGSCAILAHLGAILGPSWGHLGANLGLLGPTWGHLGPAWRHLAHSWGYLGPAEGALVAIWGPFPHSYDSRLLKTRDKALNTERASRSHAKTGLSWRSKMVLPSRRNAHFRILGVSRAYLRIFGVSWAHLGQLKSILGSSWSILCPS